MAASQGFVCVCGGGQAGARLSTLRLFNNTKRGGVVFVGEKIGGDGLVAWSGGVGGATSLTPHHLLPRLSEDRGRARVWGGVFERVHEKTHVYLRARTC